MDIMTVIGILFAFGGIIGGFLAEGGQISGLWSQTAAPIILCGTIGAVMVSFPMSELKLIGAMFRVIFSNKKLDEVQTINTMVRFSETARKEGLLALENEMTAIKNPLIEKGLKLIIDGTESQTTKDILSWDLYLQNEVYVRGSKIFGSAGGFSPTMGIIGTVMGLVSVLGKGIEDPTELTKDIGTAFIATLYGVGLANLLWLPFENKIKTKAARERLINELIIEGVLSIQAGDHPDTVRDKMSLAYFEKASGKRKKSASGAEEGEDNERPSRG
jgi:chemotaxis protein MotA